MHADQMPEQTPLQEARSEIERLLAENKRLRGEVSCMARSPRGDLGQEPPQEADFLRLEAMQRFTECCTMAESMAEFGPRACQHLKNLLGCEVGILAYNGGPDMDRCLFQSGLGEVSVDALAELQDWIDQWFPIPAETPGPEAGHLPPLPRSLGLDGAFLVQEVLDGWGTRQGWILACNRRDGGGGGFPAATRAIFHIFAKQLGVLTVSLWRHLTIIEQNDTNRISEERLSTALASNNVGLWDWDLVSGRIYYSAQWKRQLGLECDALSDSPDEWISRIHPDDWDQAVQTVHNCCMLTESGFEITVRMRNKAGAWIWINSRGHHVSSHDGKVRRMIGTQIDFSSYKLLEGKLLKAEKKQRLAKELAERENRAKSSFLAAVSHEIRTPLNGILGVFQMLRMTRELDRAKLEVLVEMGERSAKWMLRVIGESLDIARIEAGKLEINPEVVELELLLKDLMAVKSKRAEHLGLDLRWRIAADVPRQIIIDGVRLRQILANLVINSLKFTNQGFVALDVSAGVRKKDGKQELNFIVSDSGIGFSKKFGRIIFEPFAQGAESSEPRDHGIGMGLAITKELVALMGGRIKVSSQPGVGSTFTVTLPVKEMTDEVVLREPGNGLPVSSFHGKILLVDDDQISAEIGRLMLGELGFQVELAADGKQALEMAHSVYYDLILMDYWMPVMGGAEATRLLRASADALSRNVPIVALTANARESVASECRAAGMDDFMVKPLLLDHLIEKLTLHLPLCPVDATS